MSSKIIPPILRLSLLLPFLFFHFFDVSAQDQAMLLLELEDRWAAYQQSVAQQQFSKMTSFMYPPLFEVVTREDIQAACQRNAYHPDLILQTFVAPLPRKVQFLREGENSYASIPYLRNMQISFQAEAKEDAAYIAAVVAQYEQEHGPEKVCFDEQEKIIRLNISKRAVAIYSSKKMTWYFLELPEGLEATLSAFLPATVYKRLL